MAQQIDRAEKHKSDGELMKRVKELAKEKVKHLTKVCGKWVTPL